MTKYRVEAVHFVEAGDWKEAEQLVESNLSIAEEIVSKPAGNSSTDYLMFAISKRITEDHSKLYFSTDSDEYERKLNQLKDQVNKWFTMTMENIIKNNEDRWGD